MGLARSAAHLPRRADHLAERDTRTPGPARRVPGSCDTSAGRTLALGPVSGRITVEAGDGFFAPALITVVVGTTVVWKSVGQSEHDVVARDGSFAGPPMSLGDTFAYTFNTPGRFIYVCVPHEGDGMVGEVEVLAR